MNEKEEFSVAAIVYNEDEYLLLKYGLGHWEFVKGHKEENETDEETILRELEEETGISDGEILDGFKEKYDYGFTFNGQRIHKFVNCYLIHVFTKDVKLSYEHEDYCWLTIHEAIKRVTYDNAKKLLIKANDFRKLL
ncbi:MAG: bis(5'-nucleosyl)-tetraphosphatase [Promethearchaeota archaeon]